MPVTSVDVERSFSQYQHLLNHRRESLTEENTIRLVMLYKDIVEHNDIITSALVYYFNSVFAFLCIIIIAINM